MRLITRTSKADGSTSRDALFQAAETLAALAATLRANGYIVYPRPPRRRGDTVTLPNGTKLVQTRTEELAR